MKLLRNPRVKAAVSLSLVLTAIAAALAAVVAGALVCVSVLALGLALTAVNLAFRRQDFNEIAELCDRIDKILDGKDDFDLREYTEGDIAVLQSGIHKMTVLLRERNQLLKRDKELLKNSVADISHQLKTPLTTMNLIVMLLEDSSLSQAARKEYLNQLTELLNKTEWLIAAILKLSQFDAGAVTLNPQRIGLKKLVAQAVKPLEIPIELRAQTLALNIGDEQVTADARWSEEAISNIVKNCTEHTPHGGKITIESRDNPLYTEIKITDSGEGISKKDLPHIFERFYKSPRSSQGYGIGLALAKRIVAEQNGAIVASNLPEGGACFCVKFFKSAQDEIYENGEMKE